MCEECQEHVREEQTEARSVERRARVPPLLNGEETPPLLPTGTALIARHVRRGARDGVKKRGAWSSTVESLSS